MQAKTSTLFNPWGVSRLESDSFDGVVKIPALLPIGCYWESLELLDSSGSSSSRMMSKNNMIFREGNWAITNEMYKQKAMHLLRKEVSSPQEFGNEST